MLAVAVAAAVDDAEEIAVEDDVGDEQIRRTTFFAGFVGVVGLHGIAVGYNEHRREKSVLEIVDLLYFDYLRLNMS